METGSDANESEDDAGRLDAEKLEILRAWGTGLAGDAREEVRAAGRAITLLIEEIDRLYVELWHARDGAAPTEPEPEAEPAVEEREATLVSSLLARIGLSAVRRAQPRA